MYLVPEAGGTSVVSALKDLFPVDRRRPVNRVVSVYRYGLGLVAGL
nr:hypothetical protein [uncultured Caulobacter sp.]